MSEHNRSSSIDNIDYANAATGGDLWTVSYVVGFTVFFAAVLVKMKKDQMTKKAARDPVPGFPSAKGAHWLCGHTIVIRNGNLANEDGFLNGHKKVYDDPAHPKTGVASLWFFNIPSVSVLQGKDVKKILHSSSYRKPNRLVDAHIFNIIGRRNLISLTGKDWRCFRNAIHKSFTHAVVKRSQRAMHEVGNSMTESLLREIALQKNNKNEIRNDDGFSYPCITRPVLPLMKMATVDAFGVAILDGFEFKCSQHLEFPPTIVSFEHLTSEFARRFRRPWDPTTFLYEIPTASNREYKKHQKRTRTFVTKQIAQARARIKNEERDVQSDKDNANNSIGSIKQNDRNKPKSELLTNLIKAAAIEASKHGNDSGHTRILEETLNDVVMTLLFGAYETASITLTYSLYLLATNPHVQAYCVEEVETVMWKERENTKTAKSENDDDNDDDHDVGIEDLPYTNAVILEAMRLFPPAPVTRRNLERPVKLPSNGKVLPKGQLVNISIWSVHRSEFNFPRPNDMIPERWVRKRKQKDNADNCVENDNDNNNDVGRNNTSAWEERGPKDDDDSNIAPANRDAFCVFAAGARNCVGRVFAMRETVIILACLVKKLKFELVSPDYKVKPTVCALVQQPIDKLPMRIRER